MQSKCSEILAITRSSCGCFSIDCRKLIYFCTFIRARPAGSPWVFCHLDGSRILEVKHSFATACRRVEISDFRIHDLRHTCAAWLVTTGVPLPEIRNLLGHSSISTTERYAHLAPDRARSAVEQLDLLTRSSHTAPVADVREVG